jgi:hypothetical protein
MFLLGLFDVNQHPTRFMPKAVARQFAKQTKSYVYVTKQLCGKNPSQITVTRGHHSPLARADKHSVQIARALLPNI